MVYAVNLQYHCFCLAYCRDLLILSVFVILIVTKFKHEFTVIVVSTIFSCCHAFTSFFVFTFMLFFFFLCLLSFIRSVILFPYLIIRIFCIYNLLSMFEYSLFLLTSHVSLYLEVMKMTTFIFILFY